MMNCRFNGLEPYRQKIDWKGAEKTIIPAQFTGQERINIMNESGIKPTDGKQKNEDIRQFKKMWVEHINQSVVQSQLLNMLNGYIEDGVESAYLVFVLRYVIQHGMNLNYPAGFKYYAERKEIKEAWAKKKLKVLKWDMDNFSIKAKGVEPPRFTAGKKPVGFQRIIKNSC